MANLIYVSSTGVGSIVNIFLQLSKRGIDIYFLNIIEKVSEVFSLLGFLSQFKLIKDFSEINQKENPIFPIIKKCPECESKLKLLKPGKFRCQSCKAEVRINKEGEIFKV